MVSLFLVLLTTAISFVGIYFVWRFMKQAYYEEEVGKKKSPGYRPPKPHK